MNKKEAIKWLFEHSKKATAPFEAWGQGPQAVGWHCWGCKGEFISTWPHWEEPTLKTFPHEKNCKYIEVLKILNLTP